MKFFLHHIIIYILFLVAQKTLTPSLPSDLAVSFYLQAHKLIFAVYHLTQAGGTVKFETLQSESPVTWLNEVLVLLSVALHRAQQLRDKVRDLCLFFYITNAMNIFLIF